MESILLFSVESDPMELLSNKENLTLDIKIHSHKYMTQEEFDSFKDGLSVCVDSVRSAVMRHMNEQ